MMLNLICRKLWDMCRISGDPSVTLLGTAGCNQQLAAVADTCNGKSWVRLCVSLAFRLIMLFLCSIGMKLLV